MPEEAPAPVGAAESTPAPAERSFTQADIDRVVQERLARQAAKFEGFDDLKAKAAKLDEIEQANASELEKAGKRAAEAEAKAAKAVERANAQTLKSAVMAAAMAQHAVNPEHVYRLVTADTQLTVSDDGTVTGAQEAVTAFLKANPVYVGTTSPAPGGSADQGARGQSGPSQLSRDALKSMSPEAIVKAQADGRLANVLAGK